MKILLIAGALTLAALLAAGGRPAPALDDLRWQSGPPYGPASYPTAKIDRPETPRQITIASSNLERR
ncbi:MAG: hypothetical protein KKC14_16420 [Alphaproteobacteria bacterium]|nr:hypothetical protein [Alphaproteobacteria bacterium]